MILYFQGKDCIEHAYSKHTPWLDLKALRAKMSTHSDLCGQWQIVPIKYKWNNMIFSEFFLIFYLIIQIYDFNLVSQKNIYLYIAKDMYFHVIYK